MSGTGGMQGGTSGANGGALMRSIIRRIATGPEMSKDIPRDEARRGMRLVLDGAVDPVQAAVFLIALRMKRETDDENLGLLDAVLETTGTVTAPADDVVDLSDPYNGFNRSLPLSAFLPAVLAACGMPAVSHGVESVGPKFGATHHRVLAAAGAPVASTLREVSARLADPGVGWAYCDQSVFNPKLHALTELRSLIVKRPALTTVEVMAGPVRGRRRTHVVTGYVHKPYPRVYAMLARCAGFDSACSCAASRAGSSRRCARARRCGRTTTGGRSRRPMFRPRPWASNRRCGRRRFRKGSRVTGARATTPAARSMVSPSPAPPPAPASKRWKARPGRPATAWSTRLRSSSGTPARRRGSPAARPSPARRSTTAGPARTFNPL